MRTKKNQLASQSPDAIDVWKQERYEWINLIWSHYSAAQNEGSRLWLTSWWECFCATIAVWLDRQDDALLEGHCGPEGEVAWRDAGRYGEYGEGHAFEYLVLGPRFTFALGSDGTL